MAEFIGEAIVVTARERTLIETGLCVAITSLSFIEEQKPETLALFKKSASLFLDFTPAEIAAVMRKLK